MSGFKFSRRGFFKVSGVVGGGLAIGYWVSGDDTPAPVAKIEGGLTPNAFLQILPDNTVRFYFPRDEMGQGAIMGLTTLVAEELDVPLPHIDVQFAGVHNAYNNPEFGMQITGGSTSMKAHYLPLRQTAANTRALILDAAAKDLSVARENLRTEDCDVINGEDRHPYAQFIATAAGLELPQSAPLKPKARFKYIGHDIARIDAQAKSTGTAEYGLDVDIPGMHYAVVKRCPVAGGSVESFEADVTRQNPNVTDVVQIDNGVAVVATSFWQAQKAARTLQVQWNLPPLAKLSSADIRADYQHAMEHEEGDVDEHGDVEQGFQSANATLERQYWAPYLAHAPLEPMNAVVSIADGKAELWSGTQNPGVTRGLVARYADLPIEAVTVHNTWLGGGFGRRGVLSHIVEATQIAVACGKPVQLVWTREDDIQNGFYRPASLMKLKAGLGADGLISSWKASRVGANIMPDTLANMIPGAMPSLPERMSNWTVGTAKSLFDRWGSDQASIEGLIDDYDFTNKSVRHVTVNHGLPLTYWRSVGHSFTAFAKEALIDELAEQAGRDVVEFRVANTANNPRLKGVIELAGKAMNEWAEEPGMHAGFAAHGSFNSFVAQAAQVSVENGKIRVHKVICALDCGQIVNPDIVRGQMEGAIMFGLTAALYGNIELENGAVKESNFHNYPILRMDEAPAVEVLLVDSDLPPTGVGEPGLPPIAPAVANAVYRATGKRLYELPLKVA